MLVVPFEKEFDLPAFVEGTYGGFKQPTEPSYRV
jgi:hypothetical protein